MTHRKELLAALIVVAAVATILVYVAVRAVGQVVGFQTESSLAGNAMSGVDTSDWETYENPAFGFSVQYPSNWQISTAGLSSATPFITLGNPLTGTTTYAMEIYIEQNPQDLSAAAYVHQLLENDRAQDTANSQNGPAPSVTPEFTHAYLTMAGSNVAYELYDVFEFDHNAEQIYAASGNIALRFDFPVPDANQNLASPANNNAIAHLIVGTLNFN